jgi:hypothetical protein
MILRVASRDARTRKVHKRSLIVLLQAPDMGEAINPKYALMTRQKIIEGGLIALKTIVSAGHVFPFAHFSIRFRAVLLKR